VDDFLDVVGMDGMMRIVKLDLLPFLWPVAFLFLFFFGSRDGKS